MARKLFLTCHNCHSMGIEEMIETKLSLTSVVSFYMYVLFRCDDIAFCKGGKIFLDRFKFTVSICLYKERKRRTTPAVELYSLSPTIRINLTLLGSCAIRLSIDFFFFFNL